MAKAHLGRVGRRLAAIVAADVAGYSRLMGLDEVGTARTLREHRKVTDALVAKHGGRLAKTTGDGVLLEFPSVVDAVECAVAVQAVMAQRNEGVPQDRRMLFRIGINLGDILIEGADILGDGVNVAARLEGVAEPGGICISSSAHDQVSGKVAVEFTDLGELTLKNIARPIRAYAVVQNGHGATGQHGGRTPSSTSAPHLSIVVLPFANIGGGPDQDYFADGVTESLTTDLSRLSGALVIARNTAFTFKGKAVDVRKLGRELNIRYVLEGSVQRGGNRLRVNVQLIDAETGNHLWAERFDKPIADLFDMQDEIVSRLARALDAELIAAEARRAERSPNPDVTDLVFQGRAWFNKGGTPDHMAKARGFFQQAISLEPANTEAMVMLAFVDACVGSLMMTDDVSGRLAAAEATLTKVFSLEQSQPDHALAHAVQGLIQMCTKRADQAIAECEHALALDRNLAHAHALIGLAKAQLGRGEETEAHIKEAFRLSPRDPYAATWCIAVSASKADHSEAITWLRRGLEANRTIALAHFLLAVRLVRLGELEQARAAVQAGLALDPNFTIRRYRHATSSSVENPTVLAARERGIEALRLAGVPEG
jgi:TolB-like protein/class 3 adenylate cyclase/cytochrome c-type biogenesis protein CcmH/NrfG